ncbi:hypothetical protein [Micromonospora sp. KC207]|uniref:hypothetical protein n=1 Tax=Micromonospora sp. KC207 TaxID=2530377 RepID=UPI0014051719|nr:hypothetical protein [Micromonospora sp. KC207]
MVSRLALAPVVRVRMIRTACWAWGNPMPPAGATNIAPANRHHARDSTRPLALLGIT